MRVRNLIWLLLVTVLALIVLISYQRFHKRAAALSQEGKNAPAASQSDKVAASRQDKEPVSGRGSQTNKVFLARPKQVLATVNGTPITLGDLFPLNTTNSEAEQQIAPEMYDYFLQRAIDRELTLQAAKAQGVTLTAAQDQQLAKMRAVREQAEPGLVRKLTVDAAQIEFELRDARAFMLQSSLMAQAGATPNVTPDQVEQYYRDHVAAFGELPTDPQAREAAWQKIDYQIREQLAAPVRSQYQVQLKEYMNQLRAKAAVTVSSLPESEVGAPATSFETAPATR